MPFALFDDGFADHPKVEQLTDAAFRLHTTGILYCSRLLTDGVIPKARISRLVPGYKPRALKELLGGVWHPDGHSCTGCPQPGPSAVVIHDYLGSNKSKAQVVHERGQARRSKELHSDPELVAAVRSRDGDRCRYCARQVNWKDRRGALGATYDHVDPVGGNTYDNVVVACRGCNSRKKDRTPAEATMPLLPPGSRTRSDLGPDPDRTQPPIPSSPLPSITPPLPPAERGERSRRRQPKVEPANPSSHLRPVEEILAERPEPDPLSNIAGIADARRSMGHPPEPAA